MKLLQASSLNKYLLSSIIIGGVAFACIPLANTQNYHLVSFILLFIVSILSTILSVGSIIYASSISALVWNYFFIPPHYTFHIEKTEDIFIFGLFFIIAVANGILTNKVKKQEKIAKEREKISHALFELTKELSKTSGVKNIIHISKEKIAEVFSIEAAFIIQNGKNELIIPKNIFENDSLSEKEKEEAKAIFINANKNYSVDISSSSSNYLFFPLIGVRENQGILLINAKEKNKILKQRSFWDTFITQISNALERESLAKLAQKALFLDESDRLYKTLFNSISHEFRIPVATIMGASDTIIHSSVPEKSQKILCNEIFTASLRLNRLVENLLNISRLESGHISLRKDWHDIHDLINKVSNELSEELKDFELQISIPKKIPLVKIDFGLIEQVLYNLLFNASQYAPKSTCITIKVKHDKKHLIISISDEGPGFPDKEINKVFNKFYRLQGSKPGGLGIGLSIVKGFIEAHNGSINIENNKTKGAKSSIIIPSEEPKITKL
jgi:two-component system sensor histidine kinase KdpD